MSVTTVRMLCPNLKCRSVLSIPIHAQGKRVRCRACGGKILVPTNLSTAESKKPDGKSNERAA